MTLATAHASTLARRLIAGGAVLAACFAAASSVADAATLASPFAPGRAAPAPPTLTGSDPASPANNNAPKILGTATAGTTIRIYTDAACMTEPVALDTAAMLASPGIAVNVANNTTTTFYATAANVDGESACSSTAVTYMEVSPAPPAPVVVDTDPASPSSVNAPKFRGTAQADTTVKLYKDSACATEPVGIDTAAVFASPGITVVVGDNTTTTIWAKAFDGVTPSPCSSTFVTYVHELPKPAAPVFGDTDPDSPSNDNMPFVKGSAVAGGVVRIYTNPACTGARASEGLSASFASPGIQTSVLNDAVTTLYATVTNAAGTTSLCSTSSITYVEDSTPPQTTIDSGPSGTIAATPTVRFEFSSSEAGSRFECHLHEPGYQACSSPATFAALPAGTSSGSFTLQVRAIDRAGNEDGTPATRTYAIAGTEPPPAPHPPAGCTLTVTPLVGGPGANAITGTARSDVLLGRGGNDVLRGLAGNDCLYGEAGNDRLRGGSGADRLFGGAGADRLEGESGNDRMSGAAGNDRLTDHAGRDSFSGGAGNDRIDARDTSAAGRLVRDTVTCGPGTRDVALADRRDRVLSDCERIVRR